MNLVWNHDSSMPSEFRSPVAARFAASRPERQNDNASGNESSQQRHSLPARRAIGRKPPIGGPVPLPSQEYATNPPILNKTRHPRQETNPPFRRSNPNFRRSNPPAAPSNPRAAASHPHPLNWSYRDLLH